MVKIGKKIIFFFGKKVIGKVIFVIAEDQISLGQIGN